MNLDKINDLRPHTAPLAPELARVIKRVIASGWFVLGPEVRAFEDEFASYCGAQFCVGVASGSDALELSLRALGFDTAAEVITAPNAGMYSTNAILAVGATPVYADIDRDTLTLSPQSVANHVTPRTKAIIATHLFGRMADMGALRELADQSHLALIEDCAQAHGAALKENPAGSFGNIAAFSFYPTKNLGAFGDAGAVITSDARLADKVRSLRQYGWRKKYITVDKAGRNSRLDEIQAAILRVQLPHLDRWNAERRAVATCYNANLRHPNIHTPDVAGDDYVAHLYVIRTTNRHSLQAYLTQRGIATEVHYPLLDYQQPLLRSAYPHVHLPVSEEAAGQILTLPCYAELTFDAIENSCEVINRWKS